MSDDHRKPLPRTATPRADQLADMLHEAEVEDRARRTALEERAARAADALEERAARAADVIDERATAAAEDLEMRARHTPAHGICLPEEPIRDPRQAPAQQDTPAAQSTAKSGMLAVVAMVAIAAIGGIAWAAVAGAQAAEASTTAKAAALELAAVKADTKTQGDALKAQAEVQAAHDARIRDQEKATAAILQALTDMKTDIQDIKATVHAKGK